MGPLSAMFSQILNGLNRDPLALVLVLVVGLVVGLFVGYISGFRKGKAEEKQKQKEEDGKQSHLKRISLFFNFPP